jgi:hypothetical protein
MKAISAMEKRGTEYKQMSAKTDGMSKGGAVNTGGAGPVNKAGMRGGKEFAQESAKTTGLCK